MRTIFLVVGIFLIFIGASLLFVGLSDWNKINSDMSRISSIIDNQEEYIGEDVIVKGPVWSVEGTYGIGSYGKTYQIVIWDGTLENKGITVFTSTRLPEGSYAEISGVVQEYGATVCIVAYGTNKIGNMLPIPSLFIALVGFFLVLGAIYAFKKGVEMVEEKVSEVYEATQHDIETRNKILEFEQGDWYEKNKDWLTFVGVTSKTFSKAQQNWYEENKEWLIERKKERAS